MLFESLFEHAAKTPDDIAIIDDSGQYTHRQVAMMSAGLGVYLATCTSKDKVGLLLPAGVGFAVSFYGTLLAGKSVVPINFLLGERETAHVIGDSGIDAVVTIPQLAGKLKETPLKVIDLTQLLKAAAGAPLSGMPKLPSPRPDDLAVLMYTSGTSALPKGVMLTYGNLQSDVDAAIKHARLEGRHRFLGIIPLFHSTGLLGDIDRSHHAGCAGCLHRALQPGGDAECDSRASDFAGDCGTQHVWRTGPAEGCQAR